MCYKYVNSYIYLKGVKIYIKYTNVAAYCYTTNRQNLQYCDRLRNWLVVYIRCHTVNSIGMHYKLIKEGKIYEETVF